MRSADYAKELAAKKSLDFIKNGMVVGLGTGSTAACFIKLRGERVKHGLKIRTIPSSNTGKALAESLSIPIIDFQHCPEIDVASPVVARKLVEMGIRPTIRRLNAISGCAEE